MKRIQSNLAYLATLADRKMTAAAAKGPNFLTAPALSLDFRLRVAPPAPDAGAGAAPPEDPNSDREERIQYIRELYGKLQSLYPGIDYTKEPAFASQPPNQAGPGGGPGGPGGPGGLGGSGGPNPNHRGPGGPGGPGGLGGPGGPMPPHAMKQGSPPMHRTPQMGMMQGPPGPPQSMPMA